MRNTVRILLTTTVLLGVTMMSAAAQDQPAPQISPNGQKYAGYSPRASDIGRRMNASDGLKSVPYTLDEELLEWPLPKGEEAYGVINGKHLKTYVADLVAIPERYRDQGHQFWGRITGTSADHETQEYLMKKLREAGVEDVHAQPLDLAPQWIPQHWNVAAVGNGGFEFKTAQPALSTPATSAEGIDLEAVYVGLGSEAEYFGRDVRGKAVLIYSATRNHQNTSAITTQAARVASEKGAAAVLIIFALPGNVKAEFYNPGSTVPTFTVGMEEGVALRDMIAKSPTSPPHVKIQLQTEMIPGTTANIWGTLPGMTDEKIYLVAHRDGFFSGAVDNGSGMATFIGLAEYFAKIPKSQRHRTIVFLATTGHHGNGPNGKPHVTESGVWVIAHHEELFPKAALLINLEHTAAVSTENYLSGRVYRANTQNDPMLWFVRGSDRLTQIAYNSYREFGLPIYTQPDPVPYGEIDGFSQYAPSIQLTNMGTFSHTDHETMDVIPWTGLEAVTRAYAKIIHEVDTVPIKDLQWPGGDKAPTQ